MQLHHWKGLRINLTFQWKLAAYKNDVFLLKDKELDNIAGGGHYRSLIID